MNVVPVYRTVLKQLHKACTTRPHFVQDVRFLLSLPLITQHEAHTVAPGSTVENSKATPASMATATSTASSNAPTAPPAYARTTVENYLQRPSSACYPIDTHTLFALCYTDLQGAMRESAAAAEGGLNPVAQQILRYRNLLWLRDRLTHILSAKTTELLATSLNVADGPDTNDFIPDSFFEAAAERQQQQQPGGSSAIPTAPRNGPVGVAGGVLADDADAEGVDSAAPSSSTAAQSASPANLVSAAARESDAEVIYSAGAIGLQAEMFVLCHREPFPMAARFLAGFPTVPAAELASCAHQQAALVRLVREKYPTTLTCEDGHVSLSVSVQPLDPQYHDREHAGIGYFASAHRQFRLVFSLEPLGCDGAGPAEQTEVLVVNSYFVRLDMELMQLREEVGYLSSRDVLRMLRERDYGDHFSDYVGDVVAESLRDDEGAATEGDGANPTKKSAAGSSKQSPSATPSPAKNERVFSLFFMNHTDAPMVMKGMLYYKLGKRNELGKAPIQCIPFGFVLLEA